MPLLSGFVDGHVHLHNREGLKSLLSAGIRAARNAGMRENASAGSCSSLFDDQGPRVVSSCWALYKRGGYGSLFGVPVETKSEIKAEILKLKRAGADIIKAMASGMVSLKHPGTVTPGGFDRDELRFIVEEAAALGLGVMAHANAEPALLAAAGAGVRSVEHGFFMTIRALEVIAEKNVFWTPTTAALIRSMQKAGEGSEARQFASGLIDDHLRMIRHADAMGIRLVVGTDCVLPDSTYAEAYRAELSCFEQAGIPRDAVTRIASENGARLLGL